MDIVFLTEKANLTLGIIKWVSSPLSITNFFFSTILSVYAHIKLRMKFR